MSAQQEVWPGQLEAAQATMNLFAALATDDDTPDRRRQIAEAFEEIHRHCPGPYEWHTSLFSAVRVAGVMLRQAAGNDDPQPMGLMFRTFDGTERPVDEVPPAVRFAARWITAAANNDIATAHDLWFGVDVSAQEADEITDQHVPMLLAFLTGAVRAFLASGKKFDPSALTEAQA